MYYSQSPIEAAPAPRGSEAMMPRRIMLPMSARSIQFACLAHIMRGAGRG